MIKRNGVAVMNERTKNASLAKETIKVCQDKKYTSINGVEVDFSATMDAALQGTVLYKPDSDLPDTDWYKETPTIEVVNEQVMFVTEERNIRRVDDVIRIETVIT